MDVDAADFVLDRMDVARMAVLEARQTVEKFSDPQDVDVMRILDEILRQVERVDAHVRSVSYPS